MFFHQFKVQSNSKRLCVKGIANLDVNVFGLSLDTILSLTNMKSCIKSVKLIFQKHRIKTVPRNLSLLVDKTKKSVKKQQCMNDMNDKCSQCFTIPTVSW